MYCVDASSAALKIAQANLASHDNVSFLHADVGALPFEIGELDFAYSLGVLHHVPNTADAIASIARVLKPGGLLLVYLYYALDNRPLWFKSVWRMTDVLRWGISRLPSFLRFAVCDLIAALVYWPVARLSRWLARASGRSSFPLSYYGDKSFYVMRTDALDRFGTRLEQRFRRDEVAKMLEAAGFHDIRFSEGPPFWCAIGRKR